MVQNFLNPYRPGAGHEPPYLAGRATEEQEFKTLLQQQPVLENVVLTGLRGVGKTVLLEEFRKLAVDANWSWAGSDLSEESGGQTNDKMALRILTDLAVVTSQAVIREELRQQMGFGKPQEKVPQTLGYDILRQFYEEAPGLVTDKLKAVLKLVWGVLSRQEQHLPRGLVFAYDEAQNLSDNSAKGEYPLSTLLEVFQSLQKEGLPVLLVLTGLPTLFPKLVEARTYAERMFQIIELKSLDHDASREAVAKPLDAGDCPIRFTENSIDVIVDTSGGYPYFLQFICREIFNIWTENIDASVPMPPIITKLDRDFFAGRWDKATDRQRDLMRLVACLETGNEEFSVQEIVEASKQSETIKSFGSSHVTQALGNLIEKGLVYRNRHGRYIFAVPLMANFIRRNAEFDALAWG